MKYIKGNPKKGEEIVSMLESLGGQNIWDLTCEDPSYIYYIDESSYIGCIPTGTYDYIQMLKNGEELKLSSVEINMPKILYWFEVNNSKYDFNTLLKELTSTVDYKGDINIKYQQLNIGDLVIGSNTNNIIYVSRLSPVYNTIFNDLKMHGAELRVK